jgi:hypothetical protein
MVKLKAAAEMEAAEARFVARMEEIQVKECNKAVFAPTLTAMVLSTVFALQREFPIQQILDPEAMMMMVNSHPDLDDDEEEEKDEDNDEEDDEEDDEDVPLVALGKRKISGNVLQDGKKQKNKGGNKISFKYLIRMLQYISNTWGHVYREPSHEEYAW